MSADAEGSEPREPAGDAGDAPPAFVLAAGLGLRLRPLTDRVPKCLVPVGGMPLLHRWHRLLEEAGITTAYINLHAHAALVRDHLERLNTLGTVTWSAFEEREPLGSAGTLWTHLEMLKQHPDFLVIYADNASDVDLRRLIRWHRDNNAEATMMLFRAPDPTACGIATLDSEGRVVAFTEKPDKPASSLANGGIYVFSGGVLRGRLPPPVSDLALDVLPNLVGRIHGWEWPGYHRDIGTPQALDQVNRDIERGALAPRPPVP